MNTNKKPFSMSNRLTQEEMENFPECLKIDNVPEINPESVNLKNAVKRAIARLEEMRSD